MRRPRVARVVAWFFAIAATLSITTASSVIKGQRAPCSNEGEPVRLQDARLEHDWSSCFRCICKWVSGEQAQVAARPCRERAPGMRSHRFF
ncbi:unnamed protein product [Pieris macdunnoughi]|uniref:Secreted protein n=1 Tax=Pieris macdunnoughi TaxID=345717 RepID=A0A821MX81_9NEOP|nr:unnamed protein product [Pieris macdunnoughi]